MPSSRGSSQPRDWTHISCSSALQVDSLPTEPPGKPIFNILRILKFLFKAKMLFCYTRHKPYFLWSAQSIPLGVLIVNIYIIMTILLILWIKACTFCRCISSKNTSSEFLWGSPSMHYQSGCQYQLFTKIYSCLSWDIGNMVCGNIWCICIRHTSFGRMTI